MGSIFPVIETWNLKTTTPKHTGILSMALAFASWKRRLRWLSSNKRRAAALGRDKTGKKEEFCIEIFRIGINMMDSKLN